MRKIHTRPSVAIARHSGTGAVFILARMSARDSATRKWQIPMVRRSMATRSVCPTHSQACRAATTGRRRVRRGCWASKSKRRRWMPTAPTPVWPIPVISSPRTAARASMRWAVSPGGSVTSSGRKGARSPTSRAARLSWRVINRSPPMPRIISIRRRTRAAARDGDGRSAPASSMRWRRHGRSRRNMPMRILAVTASPRRAAAC